MLIKPWCYAMLTLSMNRTFTIAGLLTLGLGLTAQAARSAASDSVELKGPIPTQGAASVSMPASMPVSVPDSVPVSVPIHTAVPTTTPAGQTDAGAIGGLAPGEDGTMTQDMILVSPENPQRLVGKPLSDLTGTALKMKIDRSDIVFDKLRGVMITVTNETNRPIVVDGDQAKALIGGKSYACVPVAVIQQAIVPRRKISLDFEYIMIQAVPAAITVGASPTIRVFEIS
jgi:hypothetical protein